MTITFSPAGNDRFDMYYTAYMSPNNVNHAFFYSPTEFYYIGNAKSFETYALTK